MLDKKMKELEQKVLNLAEKVSDMFEKSIDALLNDNEKLAKEVIEKDEPYVNLTEIEIEKEAINLMALYSPKAMELRKIVMFIKINNDLERIGDHAENIAQNALYLINKPRVKPYIDLPRMAEETKKMLKDSLDAFIENNSVLAREVCKRDEIVDALNDQILRELITYMISDPKTIDRAIRLILITRNIERIADLATNLAEDVVYIVEGKIIKHHYEELK